MRKFCISILLLFLISSNFGALIAHAQNTSTEAVMTKISVDRKGRLKTEDGKELTYKLFAFSTYDSAGKKRLKKGQARKRPGTMYIPTSMLENNSLEDKTSAEYKAYRSYMRAEKRSVYKKHAVVKSKKRVKAYKLNLKRSNIKRPVHKKAVLVMKPAETPSAQQQSSTANDQPSANQTKPAFATSPSPQPGPTPTVKPETRVELVAAGSAIAEQPTKDLTNSDEKSWADILGIFIAGIFLFLLLYCLGLIVYNIIPKLNSKEKSEKSNSFPNEQNSFLGLNLDVEEKTTPGSEVAKQASPKKYVAKKMVVLDPLEITK